MSLTALLKNVHYSRGIPTVKTFARKVCEVSFPEPQFTDNWHDQSIKNRHKKVIDRPHFFCYILRSRFHPKNVRYLAGKVQPRRLPGRTNASRHMPGDR